MGFQFKIASILTVDLFLWKNFHQHTTPYNTSFMHLRELFIVSWSNSVAIKVKFWEDVMVGQLYSNNKVSPLEGRKAVWISCSSGIGRGGWFVFQRLGWCRKNFTVPGFSNALQGRETSHVGNRLLQNHKMRYNILCCKAGLQPRKTARYYSARR